MVTIHRYADTIFTGGDIVTIDDGAPAAAAVAVAGGKILAVGDLAAVREHRGPGTAELDLAGKTLLPGFIDGHSHFSQATLTVHAANLTAPPVGDVRSIAQMQSALRAYAAEHPPKRGEWVIGYGYDGSALEDKRNATRDDLDPLFPDTPVVLVHVSGHGCILNSAAFKLAGIDASTADPPGGLIARRPGSNEPAGLLMENAWFPVARILPRPSPQEAIESIVAAQTMYASNGYTTAQDAPFEPNVLPLYLEVARQGRFFIDLVGYAQADQLAKLDAQNVSFRSDAYHNRFRVGGIKIVLDGSPQGKTAYFTQPYLTGGPNGEPNYRGAFVVPPAELNDAVKCAYESDAQVLIHCNGDAAIDMVLEAHRAAGAPLGRRTTIVHSQFVRRDQLERYREYGFAASFFTNHTFFWGDLHVENLGKDRAYFLSPMKTARSLGIRTSNHSDFFVTPLNPLFIAWTAVNRVSRSGQVIGPEERLSALEALKALTIDAAHQYFEEDRKGSISAGKLADFVVLDKNPLSVDPAAIKDIKVLETVKEGRSVYSAP